MDKGLGGIKIKVGQPDMSKDICRQADPYNPEWIEEPLSAYDVEGHAELAVNVESPIASGEI